MRPGAHNNAALAAGGSCARRHGWSSQPGVTMRTAVVAIFAVAIAMSTHAQYQPCGKGEECLDSECCMLTGNRYGTPACQPLRKIGDTCRPNAQPQNFTLSAGPNEVGSLYTGVYWAVCPCQAGLQCAEGRCT